ncbi:hypothetical protein ADK59_34405 [Streptomyces sp. XY332]|nr:hypothetical protein ADK59_34405 [Streptomyces sp. XY332]
MKRTLVVGVDGSPESGAAADWGEPYEKAAPDQALEPWRLRFPEVEVVAHVERGSAGHVLLSEAADAQLVVVGRRVRESAVGTRIGSVAHAVLHHGACPVAVVPDH